MKALKSICVSFIVVSVILFVASSLSSCVGREPTKENRVERSHDYSIYTELLKQYPLGSDYDDIMAYITTVDVIYATDESDGGVFRVQLYGGQLFFTSDEKLHIVSSTEWQTPDGFGVGSNMSEVRGALGNGSEIENSPDEKYIYKTENGNYTVNFNDEGLVTHWILS
ncbi:MAG: hypothetical protein J5992_01290 [Oscillospiraceae bacterium]|nr:hypothetical protein [Oscillospiraceae bacterium]